MDWHKRYLQQARWTAELRQYLFNQASLSQADAILEVGCGTGAVLGSLNSKGFDRSNLKESARLYGLDINADYLQKAADFASGVYYTLADAHQLPFQNSEFDIVYCHFLLLWVAHPEAVIEEMVRVVRPGGWVMALAEPDYGGRIDYPDSLVELGQFQERALRAQGVETRLGRRLHALYNQAGLVDTETGILGAQWRAQPVAADLEQEWEVIEADLEGLISPEELARHRRLDESAWRARERLLFVPTFYAVGRRRIE